MKAIVFSLGLILFNFNISFACCAETDYRLLPIGEINNQVVFIEFNLKRNCDMGVETGRNHRFWVKGLVSLVKAQGKSLNLIQTIDSVDVVECICSYEDHYNQTQYENELTSIYSKGLAIASKMKGFQIATTKNIIFNDTLGTKIVENDSGEKTVRYKDLFKLDLTTEVIMSCYPDQVAEVRSYTTANFEIIVMRLRCHLINEEAKKHNKEQFEKLETAFWREKAQWHGMAKDYWTLRKR